MWSPVLALLLIPAVTGALAIDLGQNTTNTQSKTIPGQWIAVMHNESTSQDLAAVVRSLTDLLGREPKRTFEMGKFRAVHVHAPESAVDTIRGLAQVAYVEPNAVLSLKTQVAQRGAGWGLARMSNRDPGSDVCTYDSSAGHGTYAYIIDTGILTEHADFEGRASWGAVFVDGANRTDDNGHGTHVAGTTGSKTYGVAKKTNLIAVKVLDADGSGAVDQIVAGLQWTVLDAQSNNRTAKSVVNMSLGTINLLSQTINDAVNAAVEAGLFVAVAAGNDDLPALLSSPASARFVCTVGATDESDDRAIFSNWGVGVSIFAPGVNIKSTWNNGTTNVISGTSMAAPHIAGLAAYILGLEGVMSPAKLCARVQAIALQGVVRSSWTTNNYLANYGDTKNGTSAGSEDE